MPPEFWDDPTKAWDQPGLTWPAENAPTVTPKHMTTYPVDEVLGMGTKTIALLNQHKAAMIAKSVDPSAIITKLTGQGPVLSNRNAEHDQMQKDIAPVTAEVAGLKDTHYTDASAAIDLVIGTFGKRSSEAKQAQDIRKGLTKTKKRAQNGGPTPPPNP